MQCRRWSDRASEEWFPPTNLLGADRAGMKYMQCTIDKIPHILHPEIKSDTKWRKRGYVEVDCLLSKLSWNGHNNALEWRFLVAQGPSSLERDTSAEWCRGHTECISSWHSRWSWEEVISYSSRGNHSLHADAQRPNDGKYRVTHHQVVPFLSFSWHQNKSWVK